MLKLKVGLFYALGLGALLAPTSEVLGADPLCKTTVSGDITLTADMDCAGETGSMLSVSAPGVVIDGGGFTLNAPNSDYAIRVSAQTGVVIKNLTIVGRTWGIRYDQGGNHTLTNVDISGASHGVGIIGTSGVSIDDLTANTTTYGVYSENLSEGNTVKNSDLSGTGGTGIYFTNARGLMVDNVTVGGRNQGISVAGSGNTIKNSTLKGNGTRCILAYGSSLTISNNDLRDCSTGLQIQSAEAPLAVANDNLFGGNSRSIQLSSVNGLTLDGMSLKGGDYGIYIDGNLTQNIVVKNTDLSSTGGYGIYAGLVDGLELNNVTANGRAYASWSNGTNVKIIDSDLSSSSNRAIHFSGENLTVTGNDVRDSGTAVFLSSASAPVNIGNTNTFGNNTYGLYLSYVDGLTLEGISISGAGSAGVYGDSGTNRNLTLKDLTIDGTGSYGVYLGSVANLVMEGLDISDRTLGLYANGSSLSLEDSAISGNTTGVQLRGTGISVAGNDLSDNTTGLFFQYASGSISLDPDNTFDGCQTGLRLSYVSGLTIEGMTFNTTNYGIYGDGGLNDGISIIDTNVTGTGSYGIRFDTASNLLVDGVTGNGRTIGIYATGTGIEVVDSDFSGSPSQAAYLRGTDLTITGTDLSGSGTGVLVQNSEAPVTIGVDNDFTNTNIGIYLSAVSDLTLEGFTIPSRTYGIYGDGNLVQNLEIKDSVLSANGGSGVYITNGRNILVDGVTANGRAYGVLLQGSEFEVKDSTLTSATDRALQLRGNDLVVTGNDFSNSNRGIFLNTASAPITIGDDNDFSGTDTGIYLSRVSDLSLEGLTLPSTTYGIFGDGNLSQGLTFKSLDMRSTGGAGIYLDNVTGVEVDSVDGSGRATGVYLNGSSNVIKDSTFTNCSSRAILLRGTDATLSGTNMANSAIGLHLAGYDAPFTVGEGNSFTGTTQSLYLGGVSGVRFSGLTLPGTAYAVYADGNFSQNLTFENIIGTGTGGQGIYLENASDVTIDSLTAQGRATAVYMKGVGNSVIDSNLSQSSTVALHLRGSDLTATGNDLSDSGIGLRLTQVEGPVDIGADNDFSSTNSGVYLSTVTNITLDGLLLNANNNGIFADGNPVRELTLKNLDVSGNGGNGIYLTNAGSTVVEGATIRGRNLGFYTNGASNTLTGSVVSGNVVGAQFLGTRGTVASSTFCGNSSMALNDDTADGVVAAGNYWGSPTGPTHSGNAGGDGDTVDGNTVYVPWSEGDDSIFDVPECSLDINCFVDSDGDGTGSFTVDRDTDGDCSDEGQSPIAGDCDDQNPDIYPDAVELEDGEDGDCDGLVDEGTAAFDNDGDGYSGNDGDCDDSDDSAFPGGTEVCGDGIDQDCSGEDLDCGDIDDDGDGTTENEGDCDDDDAQVNPDATEVCGDGIDNDCADGDLSCDDVDNDGDGVTENEGDCDDSNAGVLPGGTEICGNGLDDDCEDGDLDCRDVDNDEDGYTENEGDCNDSSAQVNPEGVEICSNGVDEDCDGSDTNCDDIDDDGDGFTENDGDCDDENSLTFPGGTEICGNGLDDDCNGGDLDCFDVDNDEDGLTENEGDCDDDDAFTYPGADETCNGNDDDCDGPVDEAAVDAQTWYIDRDRDGYGSPETSAEYCRRPTGYSAYDTDCDDGDRDINPGVPEICDEVDQDCDELIDEGTTYTYYVDGDEDGYGDPDTTIDACTQPSGALRNDDDCDDSDPAINPEGDEVCGDEIDNDCDGYDLSCDVADNDDDGFAPADGDCDDDDADINPDAEDIPYDGIDQDCAGGDLIDVDDDGFSGLPGEEGEDPEDCDDTMAEVNPDAEEICDGLDNDCDGEIDDRDLDDDGVVDAACAAEGELGDCDDLDPRVGPGPEIEDGLDNDCDELVDEGTDEFDDDGDGYSENDGDCDDGDASSAPDAEEEPFTGVDEDCDGAIDETNPTPTEGTPTPTVETPTPTAGTDTPTEVTATPTEVTPTPTVMEETPTATVETQTPTGTSGTATPTGGEDTPTEPIDVIPTDTPDDGTPIDGTPIDGTPTEGIPGGGEGCDCDSSRGSAGTLGTALMALLGLGLLRRREDDQSE